MINDTRIYISDSNNPWYNLAIEELLLDTVTENQAILYLWQNRDTIVIGKNQNPWKECKAVLLEKDGGYLARRLSGGGTVYHDLGNLNFTFLVNRNHYDLTRQVSVILAAVKSLGIVAEMTGRNDLTADGRKFSGNAFCFRKNNAYHHGTVLVSSDFDQLTKYLQVPEEKIKSKGIESVRSRVVNLTELNPAVTVDDVSRALQEAFRQEYGGTAPVLSTNTLDSVPIETHYKKYSSWEWRYGDSPKFDMELSTRFPWGGIDLCLTLEQGTIISAAVYSDALDEAFIEALPAQFAGRPLHAAELAESMQKMDVKEEQRTMREEIAGWLAGRIF